MIPVEAVEAARLRLVELRADGAKAAMWRTDDIDALVSALEAAAPYMLETGKGKGPIVVPVPRSAVTNLYRTRT